MPANDVEVTIAGTDVSDRVRSVQINRGRRLVNDPLRAGTCTVQLYNNDGELDPWNVGSTLNPLIVPGAYLVVKQTGTSPTTIFTGRVDRWRPDFEHRDQSTVTVDASDIFSDFARVGLSELTPPAESSDARALRIVSLPEMTTSFFFKVTEAGASWLGAFPIPAGTTGLQALQQVQDSEQGDCFIDRAGVFRFLGRYTTAAVQGNLEFRHTGTGAATPPRVAVGITDIEGRTGIEDMINRVVAATREGGGVPAAGAPWVLDDTGSQTTYSQVITRRLDLITNTDEGAFWVALWVLSRQNLPTFHITSVETVWNAASAAVGQQMLESDIGDLVRVIYRGPSGIDYNASLRVLGISHSIEGRNRHRIRWHLCRDQMNVGFFTLGTSSLGGLAALGY